MSHTLPVRALREAVGLAVRVADKDHAIVTGRIELRLSGGKLTARCTDYETEIEAIAKIDGDAEVHICTGAKMLASILAACAGETVTLAHDGSMLRLQSGRMVVSAPTFDLVDFPEPLDVAGDPVLVPARALTRALATHSWTSHDDSRPAITAVSLTIGAEVRGEATDGHRMIRYAQSVQDVDSNDRRLLVVSRAARDICSALGVSPAGDVPVWTSKSTISIATGSARITTRLVDAAFPDTDRVYELAAGTGANKLRIDAAALRTSLERLQAVCASMANGDNGVLLEWIDDLAGGLRLCATGPGGSIEDMISAVGTINRLRISGTYLLAAIAIVGGPEVTIASGTDMTPIMVTGSSEYVAIVMPMRV